MSITKALALCICPIVGTGITVQAVPAVKRAVHRATAPRVPSAPKVIERPAPVAPSAAIVLPCPVMTSGIEGAPLASIGRLGSLPSTGRLLIDQPRDVPAVPEPNAWAMMLVGLGAVGGMMRRKTGGIWPPITRFFRAWHELALCQSCRAYAGKNFDDCPECAKHVRDHWCGDPDDETAHGGQP